MLRQEAHNLDFKQLFKKLLTRTCGLSTLPINLPTCECQEAASLSNQTAGKGKLSPVENIHKLSGRGKESFDQQIQSKMVRTILVENGVLFFSQGRANHEVQTVN